MMKPGIKISKEQNHSESNEIKTERLIASGKKNRNEKEAKQKQNNNNNSKYKQKTQKQENNKD